MYRLYQLMLILILSGCSTQSDQTLKKNINTYPSASGIEYFDNRYYVIGDDAKSVLILGNSLNILDSVNLYDFEGYRFPKEIKPDLEAITALHIANRYYLFITGSGSVSPFRDSAWVLDARGKEKTKMSLDSVFQYLKKSDEIKELNIEGVCAMDSILIFANRGHLNNRKNHLIICENVVSTGIAAPKIKILNLENPAQDSAAFSGVSGLSYSAESDLLLLTFSTEHTSSAYGDGAIGNSYLWIINGFSTKLNAPLLIPDRVIDLTKLDTLFAGEKIESVCIVKESDKKTELAMVADNDNGSSTIFKLSISKQ